MSKYYCINFYTKNGKYCSYIAININHNEDIKKVTQMYTSNKMNQKVFEISKQDYDETKTPHKILRIIKLKRRYTMDIFRLQNILDFHGSYTRLDINKTMVIITDENGVQIDTVEILSSKDDKTIIKTSEHESIWIVEWLGY